jgi:type IV pilus assembly protein PilB
VVGDPSRASSPSGAADAAPARRVLLGELLVESKVITAEQLHEVLATPREEGKKLGHVLLERGWITEAQLTQTLSLQLSVPWVSLSHIDFSRQLLNRLSREVCERYSLIPIFVRHVRGLGETLYVAMDDPTNEAAIVEVTRLAGLPARPMIASASDIRSAIRLYYGDPSDAAPVIEVPVPPTRLDPPVTTREGPSRGEVAPASAEAPRPAPPPLPSGGPAEAPGPPTARSTPPPRPEASAEPAAPLARRAKISDEERARRRPRTLNLTFLDGTTIALPQAKKPEATPDKLTTEELIAALREASRGKDPSQILGEPVRWEPIVAALLSILVRKGLIADWELIEELRKE